MIGRLRRAQTAPALLLGVLGLGQPGCTGPAPAATSGEGAPATTEMLPPPLQRHVVAADDAHSLTVWEKRPERSVRGSVLLLHGRTWSSLPDFDLQAPGEELSLMDALAGAGYAVYALDARGYGDTPRDETGWLTPDRMAADVVEVLRWIAGREDGPARPALFGWSFGSTVAHLAAQRHGELVSGVALFGYWKDPATTIPETPLPDSPPREPTTAEAAASDFLTPGSISREAVDAYVKAALAADPVRVDVAHLEQFNALDPAVLMVPTQLLQGELDPIAPTDLQARLFRGLGTGDREWVVLGGCDHAAFLETCRARFLRALVGFLDEVTGPSTGDRRETGASGGSSDRP